MHFFMTDLANDIIALNISLLAEQLLTDAYAFLQLRDAVVGRTV